MLVRCLVLTSVLSGLMLASSPPSPATQGVAQGFRVERSTTAQLIEGSLTVRNDAGGALFAESTPPAGTEALGFSANAEIFEPTAADIDVVGARVRASGTSFISSSNVDVVGIDVIADAFSGGGVSDACGIQVSAFGNECNGAIGVDAVGDASAGAGVACGIGVRGGTVGSSAFNYGVFSEGNLAATGTKSFLTPHPSDPGQVVRFACLEGGESGTYFRGTQQIEGGRAEIVIPEGWSLASEDAGVSVQLTPVGGFAQLYVEQQSRTRIVVRGSADVRFNFFVNGVRRGYAEHETLVDNRFFVPTVRNVPYGSQYPQALRDVLVENGTLNTDFTPNEDTARDLGWELRDPSEVPIQRRWWLTAEERRDLQSR